MENKEFKISFGYEELVALEGFQNFKVKVDISEYITNDQEYDKDFNKIKNNVLVECERQKQYILDRFNYNKNLNKIRVDLDNIISIFNEERHLSNNDKINIKKKYNNAIKLYKNAKENIIKYNECNEMFEKISDYIKYVKEVIENEFKQ